MRAVTSYRIFEKDKARMVAIWAAHEDILGHFFCLFASNVAFGNAL